MERNCYSSDIQLIETRPTVRTDKQLLPIEDCTILSRDEVNMLPVHGSEVSEARMLLVVEMLEHFDTFRPFRPVFPLV